MEQPRPVFRWLERGTGDPVVLLHGVMGHMHDWDPVIDVLAEDARIMAPELPIFDPALGDVSVGGLARWVLAFLDVLGLDQVTLGGHSLGGHVASAVALAAPDRVSALVLTGASGLRDRGVGRRPPWRPSVASIRQWMEMAFHDAAWVTPESVDAVHRSLADRAIATRLLRLARAATRDRLEGRLEALAMPTLIVWGREDRITPLDDAMRFRAGIASSTLVVLRDCGHAPMLERAHAFSVITRAWLEEQRSARALR